MGEGQGEGDKLVLPLSLSLSHVGERGLKGMGRSPGVVDHAKRNTAVHDLS